MILFSTIIIRNSLHIVTYIPKYLNIHINHHIKLLNIKSDLDSSIEIPLEMRFQPRLAEARTNSKVLSKTSDKIETIQRKLEHSVQKRSARVDVPAENVKIISREKLTKLLMKVNIQNSVGPVHVVMSPENTVGELIKAAIEIYVKEKRRPLLPCSDSRCYELHYSQFSLESLKLEDKLLNLESRSFFLCTKPNCRINLSLKNKAKGTEKLPLILSKFMDLLIQIVINLSSFWPKCHSQWL